MSGGAKIEDFIFNVATALRVPVLILAVLALGAVIYELGRLMVELHRRRRRPDELNAEVDELKSTLAAGDVVAASITLEAISSSVRMKLALDRLVAQLGTKNMKNGIGKTLADYDLDSMRRLERVRMLVRAGPALGLMGTLIPLAPALTGLANGNVRQLSDNLRVAFSVTVLGLLIGALAFGVALVRDRLYSQDLSDLEYVAACLEQEWTPE